MLLHNSWTPYVSTNPSIYLHVYMWFISLEMEELNVRIFVP